MFYLLKIPRGKQSVFSAETMNGRWKFRRSISDKSSVRPEKDQRNVTKSTNLPPETESALGYLTAGTHLSLIGDSIPANY